MSTVAPQIIFDNSQIRKLSPVHKQLIKHEQSLTSFEGRFSTSGASIKSGKSGRKSSGQNSRRGSFVNADGEYDSDEEHPQDWTVETKEGDTWAARELRRKSIWAKTDHNTPLADAPKEGRHGSILSLWSPGKDSDGNSILKHNDDESAIDDHPSPGLGSDKGGLSIPGSRRGTDHTQERRPSILGLWKSGKDKNGNAIMLHDDEEWKNEPIPEVKPEPVKPVKIEDATPAEKEELRKMLENMRKQQAA